MSPTSYQTAPPRGGPVTVANPVVTDHLGTLRIAAVPDAASGRRGLVRRIDDIDELMHGASRDRHRSPDGIRDAA